jgi:hypothetical protein
MGGKKKALKVGSCHLYEETAPNPRTTQLPWKLNTANRVNDRMNELYECINIVEK